MIDVISTGAVLPLSASGHAVVFEQTPSGWGAHVPSLPGCVAAAATEAECERLIVEAVRLHLSASVAE